MYCLVSFSEPLVAESQADCKQYYHQHCHSFPIHLTHKESINHYQSVGNKQQEETHSRIHRCHKKVKQSHENKPNNGRTLCRPSKQPCQRHLVECNQSHVARQSSVSMVQTNAVSPQYIGNATPCNHSLSKQKKFKNHQSAHKSKSIQPQPPAYKHSLGNKQKQHRHNQHRQLDYQVVKSEL